MLLKNNRETHLNSEIEIGDSLVRVERSYRNIVHLKSKLTSYSYEPRTYKLFEELEDLKLHLELLHLSHLELIDTLKNPINFVEARLQQVNELLDKSIVVEEGVANYISSAK
ncbi:hypothetical protein CLV91_1936 [Maribacter vaceletii]|uniref:Uncharacterized protein n=1 Tax=Maribacter vaceletii TaxID=1206816 RepID=A0A495E976_9FLAO|nr:hypothetical protein [Maribacter vaceletii]RKR13221.1 hypothetical protein CLV91_1936 [Maribacter vaceletii]